MGRASAVTEVFSDGVNAAVKAAEKPAVQAAAKLATNALKGEATGAKAARAGVSSAANASPTVAAALKAAPTELIAKVPLAKMGEAADDAAKDTAKLAADGESISKNALDASNGDGKTAKEATDAADADGLAKTEPGYLQKIYNKVYDRLPNFVKKYPLSCTGVVAACIAAGVMVDATDGATFNINRIYASSTPGNIIIEFREENATLASKPWSINPNDYVDLCIDLPMLNPPLTGVAEKSLRVVQVISDYTIEVEVGNSYKLLNSINCTFSGCDPASPSNPASPANTAVSGNCGSFVAHCTFRNAFAYIFRQVASIPAAIIVAAVGAAGSAAGSVAGGLLGGLGNALGLPSWGLIAILVILVLSCISGAILISTEKK